MRIPVSETRTLDQLREHYEIEKELADRLRNASREERSHLYNSLYDELFRRVPHHPQITRKADSNARAITIARQMRLLKNFLKPEITFLEVGPGDCRLIFEAAKIVKTALAVDVSSEITSNPNLPQNFKLIISDGCSIPVSEKSVDVVYSYQLMEHLHPEDALEQLQNIHNVLVRGGVYLCLTPDRLSGPHDISKYFDKVATGFHLREYTVTELAAILRQAGFSKVKVLVGGKGLILLLPVFPVRWVEGVLGKMPYRLRKRILSWLPFRLLLGFTLVATK